jgi:hypothetical protein
MAQVVSSWPLTAEAWVCTRSVHAGFVVDKVAMGQFFSEFFRLLPVNIISPRLSIVIHQSYMTDKILCHTRRARCVWYENWLNKYKKRLNGKNEPFLLLTKSIHSLQGFLDKVLPFTERSKWLMFSTPLNTAVDWLELLLCVSEVPCSNLGLETGYPDRFFVHFHSPSRQW